MNSLILATAARLFKPLLLVVSILVLLRGHNEPGGGFVGGLLGASAFALDAIIGSSGDRRPRLRVTPHLVIAVGLLAALASALPALLRGQPVLTAQQYQMVLPFGIQLALSTVLLFDVGVYMVVMGTALLIVFALGDT